MCGWFGGGGKRRNRGRGKKRKGEGEKRKKGRKRNRKRKNKREKGNAMMRYLIEVPVEKLIIDIQFFNSDKRILLKLNRIIVKSPKKI